MEIKKSSSNPPSIEQSSSAEKASTPSASKTTSTGISSNTKDAWDDNVTNIAQSGGAVDPNALVQAVLRESYLQTTEDLKSYAEKVKYFNESKKQVRDYMEGLRDADANLKKEFKDLRPGQKSNVLESVSRLIKEDVKEDNQTKEYFLKRVATMSKLNEEMSDYMKQVTDASQDLATKKKDDDD